MFRATRPAQGAVFILFLILSAGTAGSAGAQGVPAGGSGASLPAIEGPPAPTAPAMINRDDRGRATMRAVRLPAPLALDGVLDEQFYETVPAASGFIQQVPREGDPASEQTEMWVFFDDTNLYISLRCLDSQPEREIATELRRDNSGLIGNESVSIVIDTFYDRRNGFTFQTGPLGTIREQAIVDGQLNESWNTVWDVRSARSDRGWSTEMVIPFKSLRYGSAGPQVWGINVRRIVKWKNEYSFLTAVPAAYGSGGVNRLNVAATLVGVETPLQSKNLEFKPYVTSSLVTDRSTALPVSNDLQKNVGLDFKYGLTRGLVLDATVNTDFAQVEEDLQQVNLTRFSLFFPDKREFFMEGQGIFAFGGAPLVSFGGGIGRDVPILFFSRRIGLSEGQAVPVVAGGRLTGRAGAYSIGALNIQTDEKPSANAPATNFSIVRVKRNVLRRSNIGFIATRRDPGTAADANMAAGVDGSFDFYENVSFSGYYARTTTAGSSSDSSASYRVLGEYGGDRYGLEAEHLAIGPGFNPEVGFVRRADFRRTHGKARFSPRTPGSRLLRKLSWQAGFDYVEDEARTVVQNRGAVAAFDMEFNSSDTLSLEYNHDFEFIPRDFLIAPGVIVPSAGYDYSNVRVAYTAGQQRKVSGQLAASTGSFYGGGTKKEASYSGYVGFGSHFALEPTASLAWVDLPSGQFTARVLSGRFIITPMPRMMLSSLMQYNAATNSLSSSARLRWEYRPGSELFVVYSDGRNTLTPGIPDLLNRSLALKITRLLRY
jgi:hypothetical protein